MLILGLRNIIDDLVFRHRNDLIRLHAAVIMKEQSVVVLPADSGAGKTTVVLEAMRRGWTLVGDDLAPISISDCRVWPTPRPIGIRHLDDMDIRSLSWSPPQWVEEPKFAFAIPAWIFKIAASEPVQATHVFFPRFEPNSETRLVPLERSETVARAGRHVLPLDGDSLRVLSRLCEMSQGASLSYSSRKAAVTAVEEAIRQEGE
jgi:hypothetical protein